MLRFDDPICSDHQMPPLLKSNVGVRGLRSCSMAPRSPASLTTPACLHSSNISISARMPSPSLALSPTTGAATGTLDWMGVKVAECCDNTSGPAVTGGSVEVLSAELGAGYAFRVCASSASVIAGPSKASKNERCVFVPCQCRMADLCLMQATLLTIARLIRNRRRCARALANQACINLHEPISKRRHSNSITATLRFLACTSSESQPCTTAARVARITEATRWRWQARRAQARRRHALKQLLAVRVLNFHLFASASSKRTCC